MKLNKLSAINDTVKPALSTTSNRQPTALNNHFKLSPCSFQYNFV